MPTIIKLPAAAVTAIFTERSLLSSAVRPLRIMESSPGLGGRIYATDSIPVLMACSSKATLRQDSDSDSDHDATMVNVSAVTSVSHFRERKTIDVGKVKVYVPKIFPIMRVLTTNYFLSS